MNFQGFIGAVKPPADFVGPHINVKSRASTILYNCIWCFTVAVLAACLAGIFIVTFWTKFSNCDAVGVDLNVSGISFNEYCLLEGMYTYTYTNVTRVFHEECPVVASNTTAIIPSTRIDRISERKFLYHYPYVFHFVSAQLLVLFIIPFFWYRYEGGRVNRCVEDLQSQDPTIRAGRKLEHVNSLRDGECSKANFVYLQVLLADGLIDSGSAPYIRSRL